MIMDRVLRRAKRIACVEKTLKLCKERKVLLDENKLLRLMCERWCCTDRMAKEYLKIAKSRVTIIDKEWAEYERLYDGVE